MSTNGSGSKAHLEAAAEAARLERDESVEWARITAEETPVEERRRIGAMDYRHLKAALQSGEVSAFAALCSALEKSVAAHDKTNCAVLFLRESAALARQLDESAAYPCYVKPPLFGIPFSNKEGVPMKGYRNTRGGATMLSNIAREDSSVTGAARENGAVPFVQTNVPLCLLGYETVNAIWGTTSHPLSIERTAGGSSGGEGALIGGGGAHLGIGSDIGGSIRIPASYCGIAGFKPTGQRLSLRAYGGPIPGRPFVWAADGPMATSMEAVVDVLKLTWSSDDIHARDPSIPPVPWRESLFAPSLPSTIGFLPHLFSYATSSGQLRALAEASRHLEAAGHRVLPFAPPDMSRLPHVLWSMRSIDGGRGLARWLDTELVPEEYRGEHEFYSLPIGARLEEGARLVKEGETGAASRYTASIATPDDAQRGVHDVYALRESFMDAMAEQGIDAILCPCTMGHWTTADSEANEGYSEDDSVARALKEECRDAIGLPLSVQIAVPPFRDELALRLLLDIENARKAAQ